MQSLSQLGRRFFNRFSIEGARPRETCASASRSSSASAFSVISKVDGPEYGRVNAGEETIATATPAYARAYRGSSSIAFVNIRLRQIVVRLDVDAETSGLSGDRCKLRRSRSAHAQSISFPAATTDF